jgi:hypothetical protein
MVYKAPEPSLEPSEPTVVRTNGVDLHLKERTMLDHFISSFQSEKKRLPTLEEIQANHEDIISSDLMHAVLSEVDIKHNPIYMSSV